MASLINKYFTDKNNFSKEDEIAVKEQFNDLLKIAGLSIPALIPLMKLVNSEKPITV